MGEDDGDDDEDGGEQSEHNEIRSSRCSFGASTSNKQTKNVSSDANSVIVCSHNNLALIYSLDISKG